MEYSSNGYEDAQNIGVAWTREGVYAFWFMVQPDLNSPIYDFSFYDMQWTKVPSSMKILGNISPQGPLDEGYCQPNSYFPVNEQQYTAFVKATVERYDGDGVDDMPGLQNPIKYWQVGNEPNGLKSGFADLQRITYTEIFPAFGLMEGFKHDGSYFDHTGLIYDGMDSGDAGLGVKKLGYYMHKNDGGPGRIGLERH